jgi:small subunit ribosomal protein S3
MQAGAKGVKIVLSGRLGGAEIARSEKKILGSIPLHTLEANVDYGYVPSYTKYGAIGVKVWVYRGMFGEEGSREEAPGPTGMTRARRRKGRRGADRAQGPARGAQPRGAAPAAARKPPKPESPSPAEPEAPAEAEAETAPPAEAAEQQPGGQDPAAAQTEQE